MRVLGIAGFHRDASAALVVDGEVVAATLESAFTPGRGDPDLPSRAIRSCLDRAGLAARDLDAVVFHEKPLRRFERELIDQLQAFPRSARTFRRTVAAWLGERLWIKTRLAQELGLAPERIAFVERLRAHAAAAFFTSPFEEAALLVLDDGEWATALLGRGGARGIETLAELRAPHSLLRWRAAFSQLLGFPTDSGDDRLGALARSGTPRFEPAVAATLPERSDGSFEVDRRLFRFAFDDEQLVTPELEVRFAVRDADLAASVQRVFEARVLALARRLRELTRLDALCLAGAGARDRGLVARLVAEGPFARVHVPAVLGEPASALGAALEYAATAGPDGALRRPAGDARFGDPIGDAGEPGSRDLGDANAARRELAGRLVRGELVGWAHGPLEFGTRSFAHRVVLADARGAEARTRLQDALQQGERFLPCRVAVPRERAAEWFELPVGCESALRHGHVDAAARDGFSRAAPSLVGPRGRAWPQCVDAADEPELHALLLDVAAHGGPPLLALADFQPRGRPIVRGEADAVEAFERSRLDALVVATRLYVRSDARSR